MLIIATAQLDFPDPGTLGPFCRLRRAVEGRRGRPKLYTWEHLLLGGLSGACAASATMPLDLAKTTIQCGTSQPVHRVLQNTVQQHGPAGLFRGMVCGLHKQ